MNIYERGRLGENRAALLLKSKGYRILDTNYRSGRWGELDIVAEEGGDLVFVEVKTRSSKQYGQPVEAVSWGKRQRLLRAAHEYKLTHPKSPESMRFDVVSVTIGVNEQVDEIELYRNIDA